MSKLNKIIQKESSQGMGGKSHISQGVQTGESDQITDASDQVASWLNIFEVCINLECSYTLL